MNAEEKWVPLVFLEKSNHGYTRIYTDKKETQGGAWASQVGAAFSNPFTSELARDFENTSPLSLREHPCFSRLARDEEIAKNWHPEKERGTPGLPGWRFF